MGRRPYFFAGAVLAALALFGMPNAPGLFAAATLLWMLDASLNISVDPFRAFVGDMPRKDQHTAGYAFRTAFIGAGAVIGSATPFILNHPSVGNAAPGGDLVWTLGGVAIALVVALLGAEKELYLLGGLIAFYGIARLAAASTLRVKDEAVEVEA